MVLEATNGGHDQGDVSQCTLPFMMYEAIHKQQQCAFYGKCAPSNIIIMVLEFPSNAPVRIRTVFLW